MTEGQPRRIMLTVDLLIAVAVALLSLGALVVTVIQTRIARQQQQASVWPYLSQGTRSNDSEATLFLKNKGVGPAIVRRVSFSYRGNGYPDHLTLMRKALYDNASKGEKLDATLHFGSLDAGDVLSPGEEQVLLRLQGTSGNRLAEVTTDPSFVMTIHFADVYGNCWVLSRGEVERRGDDECEVSRRRNLGAR
jgi:hypothetical protein